VYGWTAHDALVMSAGVQIILGLTGIVLSILSLIGISPLVLSLSSELCIGFAALVTGTAVSARMSGIMLRTS